jgi:predicted SAM-dependent methyltransferase
LIDQLLAEHSGIRLDIGCGGNKQPNFVGMDVRALPGVDVVWDINRHPWPFPDESVLVAFASHLVEHIPPVAIGPDGTWFPFMAFMDEVWRVLKPAGEFAMALPHGNSQGYLQDPSHVNSCNETTWAYFTPSHPLWGIYRCKPWAIKHLSWSPAANIEVVMVKLAEVADE